LRAWSKGRGKCKAGVLQHARVVCSVGNLLIMPLGGGGGGGGADSRQDGMVYQFYH
jgi:hypothetical protein